MCKDNQYINNNSIKSYYFFLNNIISSNYHTFFNIKGAKYTHKKTGSALPVLKLFIHLFL